MAGFGVARTFQNLELFGELSVYENVLLGCYSHSANPLGRLLRRPDAATRDLVDSLIERVGLTHDRDTTARELDFGHQKLLELDGVKLVFEDEALRLIAQEALKRKTGARGLRAIIESIMRNIMYEVPSVDGASLCRVTKEVVSEHTDPVLTIDKKKTKKLLDNREVSA